jgi:uncharacterized protein YkwD
MPAWLEKLLEQLRKLLSSPTKNPPTTTTRAPWQSTTTPPPLPTTTMAPWQSTTTPPPGPWWTTTVAPWYQTTTPAPWNPTPAPTTPAPLDKLLAAHNFERQKLGLLPLLLSDKLQQAAQAHSQWMASVGGLSHTGEGGSSAFDRIHRAGYSFSAAGENIAMGQRDVDEVMYGDYGWMKSSGHRQNILDADYTEVGFGVAIAASGSIYWTADFGRQRLGMLAIGTDMPTVRLSGPLVARLDTDLSSF